MLDLESVYTFWFGPRKKQLYTVKQDDLISDLSSSCQGFSNTIIPCIERLISDCEPSDLENNIPLNEIKEGLKVSSGLKALEDIKEIITNIVRHESEIKRAIMSNFADVTTDTTITVREMGVMNFVDSISVLENFTYDLMFSLSSSLSSEFEFNKMIEKRMVKYISHYIGILKFFKGNKFDTIIKDLSKTADNTTSDLLQLDDKMREEVLKNNGGGGIFDKISSSFSNLFSGKATSGFIGNPIYHLGMIWVDFQKMRNDKRILAKQATEHTLLQLKMKRTSEYDPKLEKQIEFYSNRLHALEYEIAKYEKS